MFVTAVTPGECRATPSSPSNNTVSSAVTGVLLVLDPAILEPNLDLFLGQAERGGDLNAAQPGEIHAGGELVLEAQQLCAGERRTQTFH